MAGTDKNIIRDIEIDFINECIKNDPTSLVSAAEFRYDSFLEDVTGDIAGRLQRHKLILLSGPSNSGKTTTSLKLCSLLEKKGIHAHTISLDNFFLSKAQLVPDENGQLDYESPNCLNIPLFTSCMNSLLAGEETPLPHYDFHTGTSTTGTKSLKIGANDIILVEGIHALNDIISEGLPVGMIWKVYLSVRSRFVKNGEEKLSKREVRLIRRIIRDYLFRGASPRVTFDMWQGVAEGESKYIKPFAKRADVFFDTIFDYEPAVMKKLVTPLLSQLLQDSAYREQAAKLISALSLFDDLPAEFVPKSSVIREFIGGSEYYK